MSAAAPHALDFSIDDHPGLAALEGLLSCLQFSSSDAFNRQGILVLIVFSGG
jgi:hypothetical protein